MLVFGGLAGPQLMCRLELFSLSSLTYTGAGENREEYTIIVLHTYRLCNSEFFYHYVSNRVNSDLCKIYFPQKI